MYAFIIIIIIIMIITLYSLYVVAVVIGTILDSNRTLNLRVTLGTGGELQSSAGLP